MTTLKTFFAILLIIISFTSCSNDDESVSIKYTEENPLDTYMAGLGFSQRTVIQKNAGNFELGFNFRPAVTGNVNAFIVKIPDTNPALRVTLWDAETKTPIRSEIINVTAANVTVEKAITPITLTKDKKYIISFNSADFFVRTKADESGTKYPIMAGNIKITGDAYIESTAAETIFPKLTDGTFYSGDCTFKFQQTE